MSLKLNVALETENDKAWFRFFENHSFYDELMQKGELTVSSTDLRKYGQREARLMAKIDTYAEMPSIFKKLKVSLLPTRNKQYLLFSDKSNTLFYKFKTTPLTIKHKLPEYDLSALETLQQNNISSESNALDFAYITSILKTFTGEKTLWLTVRGRQYSTSFELEIPSIARKQTISSVQIEVDGGYESDNAIYLIEAKMGSRDDINIRQLLFPYLNWSTKTFKKVIPIFFTYSNGVYTLSEFSLSSTLGDAKIIRSEAYALADTSLTTNDLQLTFNNSLNELPIKPTAPFPQANDLNKVVDTVTAINNEIKTKTELADLFDFDPRQADYYANASIFLGFIQRSDDGFVLTKTGSKLCNESSRAKRALLIFNQLSRIHIIQPVINQFLLNGLDEQAIDYSNFAEKMSEDFNLSKTTPPRRISTIKNWLVWIRESLT